MRRRRALALLATGAAALPAQPASIGSAAPAAPPAATRCDTTGLAGVRHVAVDAALGTVRVGGEAARRGGCLALRGAGVRTRVAGDTLRIGIPGGTGVAAPSVDVRVPRGAAVRVAILGAAVTVEGTGGPVVVRAAAGRLTVTDVLELTGELGGARLVGRRIAGGVRLRSATGPVSLDDVGGDLDIDGGSGAIEVRRGRGANVALRTTSGRLRWEGEIDLVGRYDVRSATGPITLALAPAAVAAGRVELLRAALTLGAGLVETARTLDGSRTVVRWATVPAPTAAGAAEIVVRTTTGAVRIGRAPAAVTREPSP